MITGCSYRRRGEKTAKKKSKRASDGTNAASDGTNAASDGTKDQSWFRKAPVLTAVRRTRTTPRMVVPKVAGSSGHRFVPKICWNGCAVSSPELRHSTSIVCFATRMSIWNSATRRPCVIHFSPRPHKATEAQIVQEVGDRHPS